MEACEDCPEIKKVEFQVASLELNMRKHQVEVDGIRQEQLNKDIEHETMIQGLTTRMDTIKEDLSAFKDEVRTDIQSIEAKIPAMFEAAINKLLARIAKWMLICIGALLLASIVAWNRPQIVSFLKEITTKAEQVEITP
jgi:hypothetical protein